MKTKWITPRTEIETFIPNEYIAACWGVGCVVDAANQYERSHYSNVRGDNGRLLTWYALGCTHDDAHCGNEANQIVYDDNNDGRADRMIETGTDGLGDLTCNIIGTNIGNVTIGSYIRWETSSGNRTWHHEGTVVNSVPGHPNASI